MKYCINEQCKNSIPDEAKHCPYCGQTQNAGGLSAKPFFILGIIMLSIMVILLMREFSSQPKSQNVPIVSPSKINNHSPTQTPVPTIKAKSATLTPVLPTSTTTPFTKTSLPPTPTKIATSISCSGAPSPKIKINDLVRVVTTENDRLVLRSVPEINNRTEIQRLNEGTQLKIFDGPVCVKDPSTFISYWFWEIKVKSTGVLGWVAEGDRSLYYIERVR